MLPANCRSKVGVPMGDGLRGGYCEPIAVVATNIRVWDRVPCYGNGQRVCLRVDGSPATAATDPGSSHVPVQVLRSLSRSAV